MNHSLSCPYPEGCSCGAREHNRLEAEVALLRADKAVLISDNQSLYDQREKLEVENAALRQQIHDLCHDLHLTNPVVTPAEFCAGCELFQKKLFGHSPIEEMRVALTELVEQADAYVGYNFYAVSTRKAIDKARALIQKQP